ncbi:uncharacterized protein LOC119834317 [Zerene cesonia]|uniref:uncharacterized protein LOC119834317 n=1 Tax=Zerene cesonia TaxID=33412 RepID=UPI0018E537BF|nr:uncharacterized protein LOC119834317 [Zerene cesonia]
MMSVKFVTLSVLCVVVGSFAHRDHQFQAPGLNAWQSSNDDSIATVSAARSANGWGKQQFSTSEFGPQMGDIGARYGAYKNSNNAGGISNCPCSARVSDWKQFGSRSSGYQASW